MIEADKNLVALAALFAALAALFAIAFFVGVPVLVGLLLFTALGWTPAAVTVGTILAVPAWWLIVGAVRAIARLFRK